MARKTCLTYLPAVLAAFLAFVFVGCAAPHPDRGLLPLPGVLGGQPAPVSPVGQLPGPGGAAPAAESRKAQLVLLIRWPERERRQFKTAVIPSITNSIAILVKKNNTPLTSRVVPRPPGGGISNVAIDMEADSGLTVEAQAYRESSPDLVNGNPIARGVAANVNLVPSVVTRVALTMDVVGAPEITALSPGVAAPGDTIRIIGSRFGSGTVPLDVSFGGVPVPPGDVNRVSDTEIRARIPSTAAIGRAVVAVNGFESISNAVLWLLTGIAIDAPKGTWDPTAAGTRAVMFDRTLQFTPILSWVIKPGDLLTTHGTPPAPTWQTSNSAAGSVSSTGLFTAGQAISTSDVTARMGRFSSNAIPVSVMNVSVSLSPATASMKGPFAIAQQFGAINVFSDGSTTSGVAYTTSDPASISIGAAGLALLVDPWASGSVVVTAASLADDRRTATATIAVTADRAAYQASTLAGSVSGYQNGNGSAAKLSLPMALTTDSQGNVFVAEHGFSRIRKITPAGDVTSWAGDGLFASVDGTGEAAGFKLVRGLTSNAAGNLYVAEEHKIRKIDTTGVVTTLTGTEEPTMANGTLAEARFYGPAGLAVAPSGTIFVADRYNNLIRRIDPSGSVSTYAGFFVRDEFNAPIPGYADGAAASARFRAPVGIALDPDGNLYVADSGNDRIRKISPSGQVTTIAGGASTATDGVGSGAGFSNIEGIAYDATSGYLYVTDGDRVRRVSPSGEVITVAGASSGYAEGQGALARFSAPTGIAVDASGKVFVADSQNHRVRKLQ